MELFTRAVELDPGYGEAYNNLAILYVYKRDFKKALNPSSKIDYYAKVRVLCVDELGYVYHKKEDTDILFQIISKRNEILPTIVTTNLAPKEWGSIFSGAAASAILDRLSFNGTFITFEGRSYRLLKKHKLR